MSFSRQSCVFSRGQHATNEPVEHLDVGLCCRFLTTPSSAARIKTSLNANSRNAQYSPRGLGTTGQCRAARDTATKVTGHRVPGAGSAVLVRGYGMGSAVLVRFYAMLCVGSTSGSSFRYYSA